ncbi:MAG TPA: type II secretion system protein GspN [Geobacteraceae bacterium]|nr:type II secretion system protein GspN [Geobacteraceae bacterium]
MNRYRPVFITACIVAALCFVAILTVIFIPTTEIYGVLVRALEREGYSVRTAHFAKAFPLGIKARNLEIGDDRGTLLKLDAVSARLSLPNLLLGRVNINYQAEIGRGTVEGHIASRRDMNFSLKLDDVRMEEIPLFQMATGARVRGNLHARADFGGEKGNYRGELRLWAKEAVLNGVKIGETPLPDASYENIQGLYRLKGSRGTLETLSLQGSGIYVRLKGEIPFVEPTASAPLNLTLELMPKPAFLESQKFVFLLLTKYLTTPGHYTIPIRGTLAKPMIQ